MLNWLKEFLNPAPKYSCTPEERYYAENGISEPVIAMLRSMHQRSRDWKIRQTKLYRDLDLIYEISDKRSGFSFKLTSDAYNILDISMEYGTLEWMTWKEKQAIVESCRDLYIKRISRLKAIQSVTEKKKTDKVRNYWKEKYQC